MNDLASHAEYLASMSEEDRKALLESMDPEAVKSFLFNWRFWARPKQLPPEGDWATWIILAGRGFGKTRAGAGWVHERAMQQKRWVALIARTPADARDFMIEGPGGILRNVPENERPEFKPSIRRIEWPNGSWGTIYAGDEPEQLRGFSGDTAWLDELAKYKYPKDSWDQLQFGMREASDDRPRKLITTTPRPLQFLRDIIKMSTTVTVTGSSYENRSNLDSTWFEETIVAYEGSRFGRQEIHAEILSDIPGALWTRRNLDENRVKEYPDMERIVVGVDPAASDNEESSETAIIVVGIAENKDGHKEGYVLDDWTIKGSPDTWAKKAVGAYNKWDADRIVAEKNHGGDMVRAVIRSASKDVPITLVHASRGKYIRAEPISALYEQSRIHHYGSHPILEDQMVEFTPEAAARRSSPRKIDGRAEVQSEDSSTSFDRVDALVWALSAVFGKLITRSRDRKSNAPRTEGNYSILTH